jgi:glycerol-3-phosphate cytidylyltransferase
MEVSKTIGITFSAFDLLHAGHVRMLEEAKQYCDYLIVGLQTDPTIDRLEKNKPTQSVVERYIQLKACRFVDEIIPYTTEQDLEDILQAFPIDVRILGEEYRNKNFTGREYCEKIGIKLIYNKRNHRFSSTSLRKEVYERECLKLV